MPIEDADGWGTASENRWELINAILRQHTPFPDEPFHPHNVTVPIRIWPRLPFTHAVELRPVAFQSDVHAIDMMGCISIAGGMRAYLYLDPHDRLVRRQRAWGQRGSRRWVYITNPFDLSDEDLERLEVGIQGNKELLDAAYEEACTAVMVSLGYSS